ncbi:hypothetical protein [Microcystis aeruginosa]|uniref:Uncharacterized protein n=1 Tax=Microcystis aeruginosa PCC 9443 TaxID=1160281 RepID=I4FZU3_MICAE|nr:hypothetical protein [Microcystis aeruginosa]CCI01204.1 conserved hypothetical protein [Microcystis aeruginosa PCC 9443]
MDITIHLSQEQREKLAYIQQHSNQDITTLLNQVIEQQYTKLHPRNSDPLKVLKESGFIGCGQGSPDLSTNYKTILFVFSENHHRLNYDFCDYVMDCDFFQRITIYCNIVQ